MSVKQMGIVSSERPGAEYWGEWVAPYMFRWRLRRPGYVYVVHFGNGIYKIGRAKEVDKRLRAFGPHELILVLEQWADVVAYEREIHQRFEHRHLYGELFRLASDDILELACYYGATPGREWESTR